MSSMVRLSGAHPMLDLGEGLLDRIEVGRVRRQIPEPGARGFEDSAERGRLVAAEIVHNDDVAGLQRRQQDLLDIGTEAFPVDRPVEQAGSSKAIVTQRAEEGHGAPATVRCEGPQTLALWRPSAQRSHVGLNPGLVDEDEAPWIEASLPRSPAPPSAQDVGASLPAS